MACESLGRLNARVNIGNEFLLDAVYIVIDANRRVFQRSTSRICMEHH